MIKNRFNLDAVDCQIPLTTMGCNKKENPFITTLEYVTYSNSKGHWAFKQLKRLAVPHGVDYASILSPGKSLCIIAREPLGIIDDSLNNIKAGQAEMSPTYQWCESPEEVTLWLSFDKKTTKQDVSVDITPTSLKITYKDQVKVEGQLAQKVAVDASLWTLLDGKLEIILSKSTKMTNWDYLVQNDSLGLKVPDAETAHEWHQRLVNMTSEEMVTQSININS